MNRRGLLGRAVGALAAAVAAPTIVEAMKQPSVQVIPGRVVTTQWVTYNEAQSLTMHGWHEVERDPTFARVLVESHGPLTLEPEVTMRCEDVASARLAEVNREIVLHLKHGEITVQDRALPRFVLDDLDRVLLS